MTLPTRAQIRELYFGESSYALRFQAVWIIFDVAIIAFFVAGPNTTLPIYVYSSIRRGVTPEINAIATIVLAASVLLVLLAQWQLGRRKPSP